jgi:type I restriction enzyme, S subunit
MSQTRTLSGCQVLKTASVPKDWDCVPLQERLALEYGRALKEEDRRPGPVCVFGSNGQVGSHDQHWLDGPGVLVGRKGTVGTVHYSRHPHWPIDTAYYIRILGGDSLRYLYYLLDYLPLKSLNAATGVPGFSSLRQVLITGATRSPALASHESARRRDRARQIRFHFYSFRV